MNYRHKHGMMYAYFYIYFYAHPRAIHPKSTYNLRKSHKAPADSPELQKDLQISDMDKLYQISKEIVSPVLIQYTRWILDEAKSKGISTLYFLARDGYVLREIGQNLSDKLGYNICCRYLFCSRASLRLPTYHLIGDEAFDLIFHFDHRITLNSFFRRVDAPAPLTAAVLQELNLSGMDPDRVLSASEVSELRTKFQNNSRYSAHIMNRSREAFQNAVGYFRQEGLFDQASVAIVDSGWTGSMQRSLRQILEAGGYRGCITGFYFGMLARPKSVDDGTYLTWHFSADTHLCNRVCFNIYLFECMLSAPHGMTMGYTHTQGGYEPILCKMPSDAMLKHINLQLQGILDALADTDAIHPAAACRQFRRLMTFPSREEVEAYNCFQVCSDTTEDHFVGLSDTRQLNYLRNMTIPKRILRKITRRSIADEPLPLWPYGTLACEGSPIQRTWFRLNYMATEFILQIKK